MAGLAESVAQAIPRPWRRDGRERRGTRHPRQLQTHVICRDQRLQASSISPPGMRSRLPANADDAFADRHLERTTTAKARLTEQINCVIASPDHDVCPGALP
jgi:hypothetical protein